VLNDMAEKNSLGSKLYRIFFKDQNTAVKKRQTRFEQLPIEQPTVQIPSQPEATELLPQEPPVQNEVVYCTSCGAKNEGLGAYCIGCGTNLF